MIDLVFGRDKEVAEWVEKRIPHIGNGFKDYVAIGVSDGEKLIGGVVYHEYRINDIQMSLAADDPRWLSKRRIMSFFTYPFIQLKCDRVTSFIPKNNKGTRISIEKIGFKEEGNIRRGFLNDDCIIYGLLKEECKWLGDNYGQKFTASTTGT